MNTVTPMDIFRAFICPNSKGGLDASGLLSVECYHTWLTNKLEFTNFPEELYRKTIVAHVRGIGGRKPFCPDEERAVLVELKKRRVWPCFKNSTNGVKIGIHGFRGTGFHEYNRMLANREIVPKEKSRKVAKKTSVRTCEDGMKMLSSYQIFINYALMQNKSGSSEVLSRECYEAWFGSKTSYAKNPEIAFRQALTGHLKGRDGRRPFPKHIESIVLADVRQQKTWPCFAGHPNKKIAWIGRRGFTGLGYHEQREANQEKAFSTIFSTEESSEMMNIPYSGKRSFSTLFLSTCNSLLEKEALLPVPEIKQEIYPDLKRTKLNSMMLNDFFFSDLGSFV